MPRLAIMNMILGFLGIAISSMGGVFLSEQAVEIFEQGLPNHTWSYTLQQSAHGHTSLFGILHILFALTMPYSILNSRVKTLQTIGLASGTVAMSLFMFLRSYSSLGQDYLQIVTGLLLVFAVIAIISHTYGLWIKFTER